MLIKRLLISERVSVVKKLKSKPRLSKQQVIFFVLAFAAVGGVIIYKSFAAEPTSANLWVDTNGGSCVRQSSPVAYTDADACPAIDTAWDKCQPGDTIIVKNGTYAAQEISGNKISPGCRVVGESAVTTGALTTAGQFLTLENITVNAGTSHASGGWSASASNVTLKNVKFHGPYVSVGISGVSNVQWLGGELGEAGKVGGKRIVGCGSIGDSEPVQLSDVSNIVFDGVHFYPQDADPTPVSCSSNGYHLEMVRIDGGTTYTTIKNSTFHNGDHSNTASIFITTPSAGSNLPHDLTFANNFFGTADNSTFSMHANVSTCQNIVVAYNSMLNGAGSFECPAKNNLLWVGNVGARASYNDCDGTHIKNVWQDDRTYSCGTDKVLVGDRFGSEKLGLGGMEGFYIQAGSPAIDAGESSYCASVLGNRDHDGGTRPTGSVCDAGAIEYGASTSPPPTPPPPPTPTPTPPPTPPPSSPASADINGDGTVNILDLSILLSNYNTSNSAADINGDGMVNILDLSILLSSYGTSGSGGGSGNIVEVSGSVAASQLSSMVAAVPVGSVTVRPAAGQSSFTVTGTWTPSRQNVTIQHAVFTTINVGSQGTGLTVEDSTLRDFQVDGGNNWTLNRVVLDSKCLVAQNFLYRSSGWKILNSTIKNFHLCSNESTHSEGFYIGAGASNGLIQGNNFDENGTTGHLFFTWFDQSGSGSQDPRNICVTGNTFTNSHNGYYSIQLRAELSDSLNIRINPNNTYDTGSLIGNETGPHPAWVKACSSPV